MEPYHSRLARLQLETLETRRLVADLITMLKIFNEEVHLDVRKLFVIADSDKTRGHRFKIRHPKFQINHSKHSFASRMFAVWNSLPEY